MWIMAGRRKARVLPDPVALMPIMSLPRRAMGQPWLWMGEGFTNPCLSTSRRMYSVVRELTHQSKTQEIEAPGIEASSKVYTGLGIPEPMMVMSCSFRHCTASASDRAATAGCSM